MTLASTWPLVLGGLERPLDDLAWDIQATFSSTAHWKHLVNGFSGYAPVSEGRWAALLVRAMRAPDAFVVALDQLLARSLKSLTYRRLKVGQ